MENLVIDMKRKCYLHFETKPTIPELDAFFRNCLQYEPILSTSYYFVIDTDVMDFPLRDYIRRFFNRYTYAFYTVTSGGVHHESRYIKTDSEEI